MKTNVTLAIVAVLTASGCVQAQLDSKGRHVGGLMTPGQARDLMADDNATKVQTLGIATGTPTATATEAQQMTSGGYAYGFPYGVAGVYGYGAGATIVSPSYYMSGVSIPHLPEGGQTIQPIIVPVPGNAGDTAAVGHLLNATGHLIDLADTMIEGQDYQRALALYRICLITRGTSGGCTPPAAPQAAPAE